MSRKNVAFGAKPMNVVADKWIGAGAETQSPKEKTKRLTFDIPHSMHTRFKTWCSGRETKMVDEIIAMIEARLNEKT